MQTITRHCGMSGNTARGALDGLVEKGCITRVATYREQRNGKTAQSNNEYYILTPPWEYEPAPET